MMRVLQKSTAFKRAAVAAAGLLVLLIGSFFVLHNQTAAETRQSGALVTIHDRGEEKVILSDGETIGDALDDAGVAVDARDAVEPALDEKMVASEYNVNIYRARPVTIIDGPLREKVITPYQTPERILSDAGITTYTEDVAAITRSDDILTNGAGLQLVIDRATTVSLDLYGKTTTIRTQGETVGAMLEEKDITLGDNDRASLPLDTQVTADMAVKVWREGKQTVTREESVNFDIRQIQDADREVGYSAVKTPGKKGERSVTYEVEIKDGKEVSRKEIASIITKQPVAQVEIIGAKVVLVNVSYSANAAAIMTAAGVSPADQDYAAYIINNENALWCPIRWQGTSGCGTEYYEKFPGAEGSGSVGYGLCQSTPAIKMETAGADWRTNTVTQMKWCHSYALGRYGSWAEAYRFKVTNGWW